MTSEQLRQILTTLNLNINLDLIQHIWLFIKQRQIDLAGQESSRVLIYAASAIAAEIKRIPSIGNGELVKSGICIEHFLRHVQTEDKLLLLEKVNEIILRWDNAPTFLKNKIKEVCRTYDIFLKYRESFRTLSEQLNTELSTMMNQMSIFWMVYVTSKHHETHHQKANENQELCILFSLIKYVFQEFLSNINSLEVNTILRNNFNNANIPNSNTIQEYKIQFNKILKNIYEIRYFDKNQANIKIHVFEYYFLQRFVDDFSNHIEKDIFGCEQELVDQVSYIELEKTLTPMNIYKIMDCEPISKSIDFDSESQEQGQNQSDGDESDNDQSQRDGKIHVQLNQGSPKIVNQNQQNQRKNTYQNNIEVLQEISQRKIYQERRSKFIIDNNHSRMTILHWVHQSIKCVTQNNEKMFKEYYENKNSTQFQDYLSSVEVKIKIILQRYASECKDINHRTNQISKVFIYLMTKMKTIMPSEQFENILNKKSLDSIFCITTLLFNYCYKSLSANFMEYCEVFGITCEMGFVPINWIGIHAELPQLLNQYLYKLEQQILFDQLWNTQTGIQMLNPLNQSSYLGLALKKRFIKHVNMRISEICSKSIEEKERKNVETFFKELFDKKFNLFKNNCVNTIIVCCIFFCYGKIFSLQKIYSVFQKIPRLSAQPLQAKDQSNNKITIQEYYSSTFIKQAEAALISTKKKMGLNIPNKISPTTTIKTSPQHKNARKIFSFGNDISLNISKSSNSNIRQYRKKQVQIQNSLAGKILINCRINNKKRNQDSDFSGEN